MVLAGQEVQTRDGKTVHADVEVDGRNDANIRVGTVRYGHWSWVVNERLGGGWKMLDWPPLALSYREEE